MTIFQKKDSGVVGIAESEERVAGGQRNVPVDHFERRTPGAQAKGCLKLFSVCEEVIDLNQGRIAQGLDNS